MSEPEEIVAAIEALLTKERPLAGKRALVTSGPTREAIDPVRYISNHSSGKQGHAIAGALAQLGAEVTLVSGPVNVPDPPGVRVIRIESAEQMLAACLAAGKVDVALLGLRAGAHGDQFEAPAAAQRQQAIVLGEQLHNASTDGAEAGDADLQGSSHGRQFRREP